MCFAVAGHISLHVLKQFGKRQSAPPRECQRPLEHFGLRIANFSLGYLSGHNPTSIVGTTGAGNLVPCQLSKPGTGAAGAGRARRRRWARDVGCSPGVLQAGLALWRFWSGAMLLKMAGSGCSLAPTRPGERPRHARFTTRWRPQTSREFSEVRYSMTTEVKLDHRHRYCRRRWKAFYLLSQVDGSLTPREWAKYTGLPLHSLQSAVVLWTRYHYIERHVTPGGFSYSLLSKGRQFVDYGYLRSRIQRAPLIEEIIRYQEKAGLNPD